MKRIDAKNKNKTLKVWHGGKDKEREWNKSENWQQRIGDRRKKSSRENMARFSANWPADRSFTKTNGKKEKKK